SSPPGVRRPLHALASVLGGVSPAPSAKNGLAIGPPGPLRNEPPAPALQRATGFLRGDQPAYCPLLVSTRFLPQALPPRIVALLSLHAVPVSESCYRGAKT